MKANCRTCHKRIELRESPLGALVGMSLGLQVVIELGHPLVAVVMLAACTFLGDQLERWLRRRCIDCAGLADCVKKTAID